MAINLGSGFSSNNQSGVLNLKKNDILNLTKKEPGLEKVVLGAGWDISLNGSTFDLDISAFLLGQNAKVNNVNEDVIYFNNMNSQGIKLCGDNRTGVGEGDDERIEIDLRQIKESVSKIIFVVTIFEAREKRQTFGMIDNSYIRLLDEKNGEKEICRFNLKENGSTATAVVFAELFKENNEWHFKALGDGKIADLNGILSLYM
ncbi:TerD family protein [Sarcina sp. JB2]|uniref:TerD family protein n=1 Tax=Candidatus Sarcina troglodytae TaxID=2726954 RepID=A0ACD1BCH5_9CLOT|nr:TerD family protein [Sarcina sp. JB2]QPJ85077.1 TerD family protein [Sarcina sp. JB2]